MEKQKSLVGIIMNAIINKTDEKYQDVVTYLALVITGILYLIIIIILSYYLNFPYNTAGFYVFLSGLGLTLPISAFIIKNAFYNESDRSRTIVILAFAHLPVLLGFLYWTYYVFVII